MSKITVCKRKSPIAIIFSLIISIIIDTACSESKQNGSKEYGFAILSSDVRIKQFVLSCPAALEMPYFQYTGSGFT